MKKQTYRISVLCLLILVLSVSGCGIRKNKDQEITENTHTETELPKENHEIQNTENREEETIPEIELTQPVHFTGNEPGLASDSPIKNLTIQLGDGSGELHVTWFSASSAKGTVLFEKTSADGKAIGRAVTFKATTEPSVSVPNYYRNRAVITGLEADTDYTYQVGNGGQMSPVYSFHYSDPSADDFMFTITSDQEIGIGDDMLDIHEEAWSNSLSSAAHNIHDSAFMLSLGDQVSLADAPDQYDAFLDQTFLYTTALLPVVGNHDEASSYWGDHFFVPNQTSYGTARGNDGDYWFRWGKVLFVVLNTSTVQEPDCHEYTLTEACEANPDARWKVVICHYSPISNVERYQGIAMQLEKYFDYMESTFDIDLFLSGHDHLYSRGQLLVNYEVEDIPEDNIYTNPNNPIHVIFSTSTGCIYREPYGIGDIDFSIQTEHPQISTAHVTDTDFNITTYNADTWEVVDNFTIHKD
ncbi:MAG: purple acid phosphatase family protein [Lachnospiraceae bacterium]